MLKPNGVSYESVFLMAGAGEFFKEIVFPKMQVLKTITTTPIPEEVGLSVEDHVMFAKAKEIYETLKNKVDEVSRLADDMEMTDEDIAKLVKETIELAEGIDEIDEIILMVTRKIMEMPAGDGCDCDGSCESCDCERDEE